MTRWNELKREDDCCQTKPKNINKLRVMSAKIFAFENHISVETVSEIALSSSMFDGSL